jgi:hypothetical protein
VVFTCSPLVSSVVFVAAKILTYRQNSLNKDLEKLNLQKQEFQINLENSKTKVQSYRDKIENLNYKEENFRKKFKNELETVKLTDFSKSENRDFLKNFQSQATSLNKDFMDKVREVKTDKKIN